MKLIKQILIFLVFTGAIFGIFTLVTRTKPELNTDSLAVANHEQIIKEIDADWNNLTDWDEDTYNRQLTKVSQSLSAGVINADDNRILKDRINKSAYTKCVTAMEREFERADCNDDLLTRNFEGLQVVQMNEPGLASNSRIIEVSDIYNLYKRVLAFNNRSFNLSPNYRGNGAKWNSWTAHQDRITGQKNELLGNAKFPRIKNITAVKKIYDTDNRVAESRRNFYDRLKSEITSYFNSEITRCSEMERNSSDANPVVVSMKDKLRNEIANVRIELDNEKYLSKSADIIDRVRSLSKSLY